MSPLQLPESPDLFAAVKVSDEWSFLERLKQLSCDVYAGNEFPTFKDRLRDAITSQGFATILTGRHPVTRKPETVAETFERIFGEPLTQPVPRGTKQTQRKAQS